jgi:hypothetical protein
MSILMLLSVFAVLNHSFSAALIRLICGVLESFSSSVACSTNEGNGVTPLDQRAQPGRASGLVCGLGGSPFTPPLVHGPVA